MDKKLVAKEILKVAKLLSALHTPKYKLDDIVRWVGNKKSFYKITQVNQYNPDQLATYDIRNMTTLKTATGVSEHDLFKDGETVLDKEGRSPDMAGQDLWLDKLVVLREHRFEEVGKVVSIAPNGKMKIEIYELERFDNEPVNQEHMKLPDTHKVKETTVLKPFLMNGEWKWGQGYMTLSREYQQGQKVYWLND